MTKIVVTTEIESWVSEHATPGDSWSRDSTDGHVSNVEAYMETNDSRTYYGDSCGKDLPGVRVGDTVYAVVVEYETGDSFGRDGGQAKVLDVFTDSESAQDLANHICNYHSADDRDFSFTFGDTEYYASWKGYFESFKSCDVWQIVVKTYYDPYSSTPSPNFRIGR